MELRTAGIRMWQFARSAIPSDITSGSPDPSTWGEATADFPNTNCDIGNHFRNQSIIANIDLCGSFAGDPKVYAESCKLPLCLILCDRTPMLIEKQAPVLAKIKLRITLLRSRTLIGSLANSLFILRLKFLSLESFLIV